MKSLNAQENKMKTSIILRLGAGLCFVGHGILALTAKAKFIALLATFNIEPALAIQLLKLIGAVDIIVGLMILFHPTKWVLKWAMIWTGLTIVAWFIHGDSLMDLMRRAPYFAAPFALLSLMNSKSSVHDETEPVLPIENSERGDQAIQHLDLSKISMKLSRKEDGEGWSAIQCEEIAKEYKRFLKLKLLYPNEAIVPNVAIDTMWHYHILDTEAYQTDCIAIFGEILHHYPYYGLEGKSDAKNFVNSFDLTKSLYYQTFNSMMEGPNYLPSFQR